MKRTTIVLGLGFGDEGKGLTTDYLCRQYPGTLVVRFSGGHQVGHTVVTSSGKRHVFSNFGSGTFSRTPTFWSRFCTVNPSALVQEWEHLRKEGVRPKLILSPLAQITTPFDIAWNRATEIINQHGSVGVGFGATVERNTTHYKLYAADLAFPFVLEQKLRAIAGYYLEKARKDPRKGVIEAYQSTLESFDLPTFLQQCHQTLRIARVERLESVHTAFEHLLFEGSQGILLDMDHGFFPHVTRSNTTSKNAMTLIREIGLPDPEVYYITRAYQTRHGNGPMTNEGTIQLAGTEQETNQDHQWQGSFRTGLLDLDLVNYALQSDANYVGNAPKHLVVTCLDQLVEPFTVTQKGRTLVLHKPVRLLHPNHLSAATFEGIWESHSPCGEGLKRIRFAMEKAVMGS